MIDIIENWKLIVIGILVIIVVYLSIKQFKTIKKIKNLEDSMQEKIKLLEAKPTLQTKSPMIQKPTLQTKSQIIQKPQLQTKSPIIQKSTLQTKSPMIQKQTVAQKCIIKKPILLQQQIKNLQENKHVSESSDSDSESVNDSESDTDSDDSEYYDKINNQIENYGKNEDLLIPININSILQRAIEEQIIPTGIINNNILQMPTILEVTQITESKDNLNKLEIKEINSEKSSEDFFKNEAILKEENIIESTNNVDIVNNEINVQQENMESSITYKKEDLEKKNIILLKEIAKTIGIKLNEGKRLKNKETLITEIIYKTNQNI